jgi:HEAT repeat protein
MPHLASALKDPDKEVRIAALSAIAKFGEAEATELVMSIHSYEDILVLRTTVTTRFRVWDKRLPGILVRLPDDPDTDILRIAAFAFR